MNEIHKLAVFCGSSEGNKAEYLQSTIALAQGMHRHRMGLVYGGGNRGLMGKLAFTVHNLGEHVLGILPEKLDREDIRSGSVEDELIITPTMHERKALMYEKADAFVALPGGIGTFEEILEVYTWLQLGYHHKPVALFNVEGYYDLLYKMLEHSVAEGFLRKSHFEALIIEEDAERLLCALERPMKGLPDKLS